MGDGTDTVILEDAGFGLTRGSTLAVIGPNGAGKTILLEALRGLVPCEGRAVRHRRGPLG